MKLLSIWLVIAATAAAQAQTFEVASVKKADPNSGAGVRGTCHGVDAVYSPAEAAAAPPLGRCVITDGRLGHLISIAWQLKIAETITGGPAWVTVGLDRFTIEAQAADRAHATTAQLLEMLQNLLVDRFKLKYHRETKEKSGFALVVAKNGPKLGAAKGQETVLDFRPQGKPSPLGPAKLTLRKYPMSALANLLSGLTGTSVVDQTGLTGDYDFTLAWDETNGPSLSTAVQEQLGLKLEPMKTTVSLFVVESAAMPDQN